MNDTLLTEGVRRVVWALDNARGKMRVFAIVWRRSEQLWDVVASAPWIDDDTKEAYAVIDKVLTEEFGKEKAETFRGIYPLESGLQFVADVLSVGDVEPKTPKIVTDVRLGAFPVERMIVFASRRK